MSNKSSDFYLSETALERVALVLKQLRANKEPVSIEQFLSIVDGIENYNKYIESGPDEEMFHLSGVKIFERVGRMVTLFGFLNAMMIRDAHTFVESWSSSLEKESFKRTMKNFFDTFGDIRANYIWMSKADMIEAGKNLKDDLYLIIKSIEEETDKQCDDVDKQQGYDNFSEEDIIKLKAMLVKERFNLSAALYANCFIGPDVADNILTDLNLGVRNIGLTILKQYLNKNRTDDD